MTDGPDSEVGKFRSGCHGNAAFFFFFLRTYPLGEVEGGDAQGPKAAEHGEDGQAQMITRRDHDEVVLTLAVTGAVRLER